MTSSLLRLCRSVVAAMVTLPMVLGVSACKTGNTAQKLADSTAPTLEGSTVGKCKPGNEASKSLVVEWPMSERAALEGRIARGLVVVRYRDCEMELITNCSVPGAYQYVPVTPKTENVKITNADELYAKIPIGAVRLEGKLARAGQLNVDMMLVGRYETDRYHFQYGELGGRCEGATHIVTGMSVGAFEFSSGAQGDIGVGAGVKGTGVEAGAGSTASKELLNRDGDAAACVPPSADEPNPGPPQGCGALLRIEVVPIDRPIATTTTPTGVTAITDTEEYAGTDLTTQQLDKRIRALTITSLAGYLVASGGVAMTLIGLRFNSQYGAETSDIGQAGSAERTKFINKYNTSLGLIFGGIGAFAIGLPLALVTTVRAKKLRNERATRLAGVGISPLPEGGVQVGASWRF